jgi:hypothetical protein
MALGSLQYPMRACSLTGDRSFLALTPFTRPGKLPFEAVETVQGRSRTNTNPRRAVYAIRGLGIEPARRYLRSPSRVIVAR